jgi:hypothetical protein
MIWNPYAKYRSPQIDGQSLQTATGHLLRWHSSAMSRIALSRRLAADPSAPAMTGHLFAGSGTQPDLST